MTSAVQQVSCLKDTVISSLPCPAGLPAPLLLLITKTELILLFFAHVSVPFADGCMHISSHASHTLSNDGGRVYFSSHNLLLYHLRQLSEEGGRLCKQ